MDRFVPARRSIGAGFSLDGVYASSPQSSPMRSQTASANGSRRAQHVAFRASSSSDLHNAMLQIELLGQPVQYDLNTSIISEAENSDRNQHGPERASAPARQDSRTVDQHVGGSTQTARPAVLLQRDWGDGTDGQPSQNDRGHGDGAFPPASPGRDSVRQRLLEFSPARRPTVGSTPLASHVLDIDGNATLSPGSTALLNVAARRSRQRVPSAPYRVLDAPGLADDFYLNLLDWSSTNIVCVGLGPDVYLWHADTATVNKLTALSDDAKTSSVSWSDRGKHVALGTDKGQVQVWDCDPAAAEHRLARTFKGHTARVGSLAWAGPLLATGGKDKTILVRDLRCAEDAVATLKGHTQEVCGLKWNADHTLLASGGNDNKLLVWSSNMMPSQSSSDSANPVVQASQALWKFSGHTAAVKAIAWSPHQAGLLASGGGTQDKTIRFWNSNTGSQLGCVDTGSQVCQLLWTPSRSQLVSCHGYSTNSVVVWDWPSMTTVASMTGHTSRVLYMAMSPDGGHIVTGAGDETLRFWEIYPSAMARASAQREAQADTAGAAATLGKLMASSPRQPLDMPEVGVRSFFSGRDGLGPGLDVR